MNTRKDKKITVELFLRSLCSVDTHSQQESIIHRLDRLKREGAIDRFTVTVWGKQIAPNSVAAGTDTGERLLERISAFTEWATEHDVTLRSCFKPHKLDHALTGETYSTIVLPVVCLAEFESDTIRHVVPHSDGVNTYTVSDRLEALERDTVTTDRKSRSTDEVNATL